LAFSKPYPGQRLVWQVVDLALGMPDSQSGKVWQSVSDCSLRNDDWLGVHWPSEWLLALVISLVTEMREKR